MERKFEICEGYENEGITLPERATKNSAGYELKSAETIVVYANDSVPTLVETGIKAEMMDDDVLLLANRSSNNLVLSNGIGIYENGSDDNITFSFLNNSEVDIKIEKGDVIGQGVFLKFETILEYNRSLGGN